jgi:hypothetical protein
MEKEAVKLSYLKKENQPFELEQDYFDKNKAKLAEEIENQVNGKFTLASIPKQPIQKISTGYFKNAEKEINAKKDVEIFEEPKKQSFWLRKRSVFSAVAGVAIIGILTWLSLPQNQDSIEEDKFLAFSTKEMHSYLINQGVFAEDFLENDITKAESDSLIINQLDFNQKEIINYLENQETDL